MADFSDLGACGGEDDIPHVALEGIINISLDDDQLNLFITPSNTNEVDSDSEDDCYLKDLIGGHNSLLDFSVGDKADMGHLAESTGPQAVNVADQDTTLTMVSPTPGATKYQPQCSAGVFDLGFSLVSQEEEGDILSLRQRIEKNNPNLGLLKDINESQEFAEKQMYPFPGNTVCEKPPKGKPKKGFNSKNTKKKCKEVPDEETVDRCAKKLTKPRFHSASEDEIAKLQMDAKAEGTHNQTRWGISILREWLKYTGRPVDFEGMEPAELGVVLKHFYAEVRQKDGREYSRSSLTCIRAAIQRHLSGPPYNSVVNIMADGHFKSANSLISGAIRNKKRRGEDESTHHLSISEKDVELMYSSGVLSKNDAVSLQYKTFFELSLHFGRRGREGLRELNKSDIVFKTDDQGVEFATLKFNPHEKNHPGKTHHEAQHVQKMYATGGEHCPVDSLKLYLSKLNPECESFFQQPRGKEYMNSCIWYSKAPVGVNTLGNFMATISQKAGLKNRYTNHCIRATTVTSLRKAGVAPSDIVAVTGHRSIASIDSYSSCTDDMRKNMSRQLSKAAGLYVEDGGPKKSVPVSAKCVSVADTGVNLSSPVRDILPVMAVKPTPKNPKKMSCFPPRRSPRLAAQREGIKNANNGGGTAKKLVYLEDDSGHVQELGGAESNDGRQVIIIKGGNITIHYH